jgi:hypothetical protein
MSRTHAGEVTVTVLVDDPLIAAMTIRRPLPLHDSSRRLRELYPECPRVYGVAVMADVSRRRWWPLASALSTGRLEAMYRSAVDEVRSASGAALQIASTLAHAVIGRVVPLVLLEGRAWDPGLENLWVHVDSKGSIDWAGVVDPTLRVLPDDPCATSDAAVRLPSEAALITWTAHRCHRALAPLFAELHRVSDATVPVSAMWGIVGSAVVGAATQMPMLAGTSEMTSTRRGQAVLDALVGFGLQVRGPRGTTEGLA